MDYFSILNLNKEPFSNSPDPDYFFHSQQHVACLQKLELSLRLRRGLNVVIGEVGTGKTTLCRQLIRRFSSDQSIETHLILDPYFSTAHEFLMGVAEMLSGEKPDVDSDDFKLKERIKQSLFEKGVDQGLTVVLIIDEGQKIPAFCLELLREFLNFETNDHKLLQIAIFAQKEFNRILEAHANFADRINLLHVLEPMSFKDTRSMIQYRLNLSSEPPKRISIFTGPALWAIYRATKGYPRKIVNLCHRSILAMIIQNRTKANWFLVRSCIQRVFDVKPGWSWKIVALVLLVAAALSIYGPRWLPQFKRLPIAGESKKQAVSPVTVRGLIPAATTHAGDEHPSSPSAEMVVPDTLGPEGMKLAAIVPNKLPAPVPEKTSEAETRSESAATNTVSEPPPSVLGQLRVKRKETLGGLIQTIYGVYNSVYLKSVIHLNPHIADPNTIKVEEVILFPAVPTSLKPPPLKQWWVEIQNEDNIEAAFKRIRYYPDNAPSARLVPHWERYRGLTFSLLLNQYFYDETSAQNKINSLPDGLKSQARVISDWDAQTVFYANPYQAYIP